MHFDLQTSDNLTSEQFEIAVRKLADSMNFGTDSSPFVGVGVEYVQSRQYVDGDPIRSVDWKVTARTGRLYVKEYEAPRCMPVMIVLDSSASMCVSSHSRSKYAIAVRLAGGLALSCLARISPVGLIGCGTRRLRYEPSLERTRVFQWLQQLRRYSLDECTLLGTRLRELSGTLACNSLVIVLSDFHDPDAVPALKLISQRHDCIAIQLQDPAEKRLAGSGFFRGREAETGNAFTAHSRTSLAALEETGRALAAGGIDHLLIRTDKPFVHLLANFLKYRGNIWRGSR
jgi:uncharacterized protein (DUF58 family)